MPETIDSANAAASTLFLGHNGEWWDFSLIIAGILVALAATAAVIATAGSIVAHKREAASAEQELGKYKLETEGKIKSAESAGETAKADAAKARSEIAESAKQTEQAKASAAEANRKAELERLERIKLEATVAPRSLSVAQQQALAAVWHFMAGKKISVTSYSLDGEGAGLASQIIATLKIAGIDVENRLASVMPMGGFALGVHVTGSDEKISTEIRNGLVSTGLFVAPPGTPQGGGAAMATGAAPGTETPAADILIGVKPVPTIR